jgi:hypothetical protein
VPPLLVWKVNTSVFPETLVWVGEIPSAQITAAGQVNEKAPLNLAKTIQLTEFPEIGTLLKVTLPFADIVKLNVEPVFKSQE